MCLQPFNSKLFYQIMVIYVSGTSIFQEPGIDIPSSTPIMEETTKFVSQSMLIAEVFL